jgi:hypothetical protein
MAGIDEIDTANVKPCPGCGDPVRNFSGTPIGGAGLDLYFPGPWYCDTCIQIRCVTANVEAQRRQAKDTKAP